MWNDDIDESIYQVPIDVIDIYFKIDCQSLPIDHIDKLTQSLMQIAPWITDSAENAIHPIYGAGTGNGWQRSDKADDLIYLSRRTPFILRIHHTHLANALALSGQTIQVDGHALTLVKGKSRPLSKTNTLHARNVYFKADTEAAFLQQATQQIAGMGIACKKILCGKSTTIQIEGQNLLTHSLMIADLPFPDAVRLQQRGIGLHRLYGCGIFIPHKTLSTSPSTET